MRMVRGLLGHTEAVEKGISLPNLIMEEIEVEEEGEHKDGVIEVDVHSFPA